MKQEVEVRMRSVCGSQGGASIRGCKEGRGGGGRAKELVTAAQSGNCEALESRGQALVAED